MEVGTLILRVTHGYRERYFGITGKVDGSKQWYKPFNIPPQFGNKDSGTWKVLAVKGFVEWQT